MSKIQFTINHYIILTLCFLGFVINYVTYFPGFMSPDSFDQFGQAVRGQYDDWHPPVFAYVWRLINKINRGPELMLALHLFILWISCYLLSISLRNTIWRIGIVLLFFYAPFIHNFAGWVLKDVAMAFSWLLASVIIFYKASQNEENSGKKTSIILAVLVGILLLYGCWLRYNAIVALLPLSIIFIWTFFINKSRKTKIIYSLAFVFIVMLGQPIFNKFFLKAHVNFTEAQIYFHDLVAIFKETGDDVFPATVYNNPQFDTTYIRSKYQPLDVTALLWNSDNITLLYYNKELTQDLKSAWFKAIKKYPGIYIKHRIYIYKHFLAYQKDAEINYYYMWMHPNDYGLKVYGSDLYNKFSNEMPKLKDKIYFKTWFWILLNVILIPLFFLIKNKRYRLLYLGISISGFLYTAPQIIVANYVKDFRYIYWSIFACLVAFLILIADLIIRLHKYRQANS